MIYIFGTIIIVLSAILVFIDTEYEEEQMKLVGLDGNQEYLKGELYQ
jgi:hypothetical protein